MFRWLLHGCVNQTPKCEGQNFGIAARKCCLRTLGLASPKRRAQQDAVVVCFDNVPSLENKGEVVLGNSPGALQTHNGDLCNGPAHVASSMLTPPPSGTRCVINAQGPSRKTGDFMTLFYLGDPDTINYDCRVLWWENGQRTPLCFLEKLGFTHSTHLRAPTQARCLEHLFFFGSVGNKTTAVRKCAHAKVVSKITLVGDTFGV